jgi:two-component system cell cycle response regulator DivK
MAHILIVEDYRDTRDVTEFILMETGHTVVSARNGPEGVSLARSTQPDLILMDLALPLLDGWRATRLLKADPRTRHIPVIAFTAQVDEEALGRALDAGCVAIVTKPFELEDLLGSVAGVLAQQG